jgi:hypothetical protein
VADLDADYALFILLRDQHEAAGWIATRLTAAAFGIVTTPAIQRAAAAASQPHGDADGQRLDLVARALIHHSIAGRSLTWEGGG